MQNVYVICIDTKICTDTRVRTHTHTYTQAKSNFGISIELINVGRHLQVSIL
jgi:hypothetical protein